MSDLKITPQGKRVLIKLNKVEQMTTRGGIVLPDAHSEESRLGTIIALGDEVDKKFKIGDQILIAFFSGTVLHFPGHGILDDTIRMITESEIMALMGE